MEICLGAELISFAFCTFGAYFRGARRAEIIPFEPDPGNAGERKKSSISFQWGIPPELFSMTIRLNDRELDIPEGENLLSLLQAQALADKKGIAVAVNGQVAPRSQWADKTLSPNDTILIIRAAQGGRHPY